MRCNILIKSSLLKGLSRKILNKIGLNSRHSKVVSEMLVRADERGVWSHGIVRLPVYVQRLNKNAVNPKPKLLFNKISYGLFYLGIFNGLGLRSVKYEIILCIHLS